MSIEIRESDESLAAAATDPASVLCDHASGTSRADRALNIVRFHQAIERSDPPLQESHVDCVERRLDQVVPAVDAYCLARHELGHDLANDELYRLDTELMSMFFDCDREAFGEIAPVTCSDLVPSYRALLEVLQAQGDGEKPWVQCLGENLDSVAPPVIEMCTSADLSVRAAYTEIVKRIARTCPGAFSWK
jgi:hypothetical protein